ncbi:MAG: single-stranded DNA-binding protein [Actinomycetales bacterium]|nr:single-stranded DNA-binding protein [Actinomycetales bacterium]
MSYITRTGNLVETPTLRHNERDAPYTYARVAVSDRLRDKDTGEWCDGPTVFYSVSVNGQQAEQLVEAAETSGNIRVTFSGDYRVTGYRTESGEERVQHEVRADEVGASLRNQRVTVSKVQQGD